MHKFSKDGGAKAIGTVAKGTEGYVAALSLIAVAASLTEGPVTFTRIISARKWLIDTAEIYGFKQEDFQIQENWENY